MLLFKIALPSDVTTIGVNEIHQNRKEPYPKTIKVYEKQTVEVYESKYFLSVYPTKESLLIFKVNEKDIHYQSEVPSAKSNEQVQYGPYKDLAPITFEQIQLFFTFPYPLPVFTEAKRDIFVSHWGEISVDEYFNFFNLAAGIDGQFSRIDYMPHINPNQGQNAVADLSIEFPDYIHGLYYYDYIGNISSSSARRNNGKVEMVYQLRFPVFGQWKIDWNMGYMMPTQHHLYKDIKNDLEHTLEVDLMHGYDSSLTEDFHVRVILPEGSSNIRVILPSGCVSEDMISMDKYFGTLDFFGRPTVNINMKNVVFDLCDDKLRVKYHFNQATDFMIEPISMFAMVMSLYLVAMIYVRVGLNLEEEKQPKEKAN